MLTLEPLEPRLLPSSIIIETYRFIPLPNPKLGYRAFINEGLDLATGKVLDQWVTVVYPKTGPLNQSNTLQTEQGNTTINSTENAVHSLVQMQQAIDLIMMAESKAKDTL